MLAGYRPCKQVTNDATVQAVTMWVINIDKVSTHTGR